jgi:hypothetical protein
VKKRTNQWGEGGVILGKYTAPLSGTRSLLGLSSEGQANGLPVYSQLPPRVLWTGLWLHVLILFGISVLYQGKVYMLAEWCYCWSPFITNNKCRRGNRVSSGSIVSDYGLDDRAIGVRSPAGAEDFSSSLCVQTSSGAHPAGVLSPGIKAGPGRDADHSPPSSAEVENE